MDTFKHTGKIEIKVDTTAIQKTFKKMDERLTKAAREFLDAFNGEPVELDLIAKEIVKLEKKGLQIERVIINPATQKLYTGGTSNAFDIGSSYGYNCIVSPNIKYFRIVTKFPKPFYWNNQNWDEIPSHPMCHMHPLTGTIKGVNSDAIRYLLEQL